MKIVEILETAVARDASDILISAGAPVTYQIHGRLVPHDGARRLSDAESEDLAYQLINPDQRKHFETERELDVSFQLLDVARFRVSVYRQRGTVASVLRVIPFRVPPLQEIGIQDRLKLQLTNTSNGLILVTGPTGAGKSTTVASFLESLNSEGGQPRHIITIEDPIEFHLPSNLCVIDQREIGLDTRSYARGLRSALRQMPHIIFVGEMRDRETMEIALTAAETGNLVISTLATQSASKTVNRIIDVFPVESQAEVRTKLALTLRVVISQVLLKRADGSGRVAAREILLVNNSVSNLIREGKIHQVDNVIASSYAEGMKLLDDSIIELHQAGIVQTSEAAARLQDPQKARALVKAA